MRKFFLLSITVLFSLCFFRVTALADTIVTVIGSAGVYRVQMQKLDSVIENICVKEKLGAVNAKMFYDTKSVSGFTFQTELYGREVDRKKLKNLIYDAFSVGGGTVNVPYTLVKPQILVSDLKNSTFKRAEFSTRFAFVSDRVENIRLATKMINGTILASGETFSFNQTVGERTLERGYKYAKIILGGEFVDGVGGGVCQVSTTLYNAVLLSNLKPIEHHRHSLAVGYVEQSFDAMVNSFSADLRFQNNTDFPIYILGKVTDSTVKFEIYGQKSDVIIKRESLVLDKIAPTVSEVKTAELPVGSSRFIVLPKEGYRSQGYLCKYLGDKLISREMLREDTYLPLNGVLEVGDDQADN